MSEDDIKRKEPLYSISKTDIFLLVITLTMVKYKLKARWKDKEKGKN